MDLGKLIDTFRAMRAGRPLGDVVMLKLDALSAPSESLTAKLAPLSGYAPEHRLPLLRALPKGTLGNEYARFLDANGIEPLVVSPAMKARFEKHPYPLRYTTTHDLHHVLTGFDTGLAGELGVLAFNVGQGSAPIGTALLFVAQCLYGVLAPSQVRAIRNNVRVGMAMGRAAKLVIGAPLESYFDEELIAVRSKLGIADPSVSGVQPSGASIVGRWLLGDVVWR